jgi:glycosyltransferase involved in cell wall biosynthesis
MNTKWSDKFTLLTIARLNEVKGVQFVIKALLNFLSKHPQEKNKMQYKIIGGGPYYKKLSLMVKNYNLSGNIIFINNLVLPNSSEFVREEMMKCDLFLLCSISTKDGGKEETAVVLMEAQASEKLEY